MLNTRRDERRKSARLKKALQAFCQINGLCFQACTHDISPRGMTLLTPPSLPRAPSYLVRCALPNGAGTVFHVEERHREIIRRRDLRLLRLGLILADESVDNLRFFQSLAAGIPEPRRPLPEPPPAPGRRAVARLGRQAVTGTFQAVTSHLLRLNLAQAPAHLDVFDLTCRDGHGTEHHLTVRERHRGRTDTDGLVLTCEVLGDLTTYRALVEA